MAFRKPENIKPLESKLWLSSPTMYPETKEYMLEAYETNWMSTVGKNINEVEAQMAEYVGVKYAVALSAGTAALHLATKLAGEKAIQKSGCKSIIIRTAWLYSPSGRNFLTTMRSLMSEREDLSVVCDQVGSPTCAGDLAAFIMHIIATRQLGKTGLYHYSDEGAVSWYDFAMAIKEICGYSCKIRPCLSSEYRSKARRPQYSVLDKSLAKKTFGVEIPYWRDSLVQCISRIK